MTRRLLLLFTATVLGLPVALQSESGLRRLSWGAPDLHGIWLYWTETPLERPDEFGEKVTVTAPEAASQAVERKLARALGG